MPPASSPHPRGREQVTMVYKEIAHRLRLPMARQAAGRAYVVDPRHPQYAGRLARERMLDIVRNGRGLSARIRTMC
jgi:cation transport protein ChaC